MKRDNDNPAHQRAKPTELTAAGRAAPADIQGRRAIWANGNGAACGAARLREATAVIAEVLAALGS